VEAKENMNIIVLLLKNIKKTFISDHGKWRKPLTNLKFGLEFTLPNTNFKSELIRIAIREM
jgi:hypothetical protein